MDTFDLAVLAFGLEDSGVWNLMLKHPHIADPFSGLLG